MPKYLMAKGYQFSSFSFIFNTDQHQGKFYSKFVKGLQKKKNQLLQICEL